MFTLILFAAYVILVLNGYQDTVKGIPIISILTVPIDFIIIIAFIYRK